MLESLKQQIEAEGKLLFFLAVCLLVIGFWIYTMAVPRLDEMKFDKAYGLQSRAESEGDYVRAARLYENLVAKGHPKAQNNLAIMYENGEGVEKNIDRSIELNESLYQNNSSEWKSIAARNLGDYFYDLKYERRDIGKAIFWYEKAAIYKNGNAAALLGNIYMHGHEGAAKDINKGVYWLELATEYNNTWALYVLGYLYEEGKDVPQDLAKAEYWMERAVQATPNNAKAQYMMGYILVEKKSDDMEDYVRVGEHFAAAQSLGYDFAGKYLYSLKPNCKKYIYRNLAIMRTCVILAGAGDIDIQFLVSQAYRFSEVVEKDGSQEFRWLKASAENGKVDAQRVLAEAYEKGDIVENNNIMAFAWADIATQSAGNEFDDAYKAFTNYMSVTQSIVLKQRLSQNMSSADFDAAEAFVNQYFNK